MTTTALQVAVDALATHRLVRLLTADKVTLPAREAVAGWAYRRRARPEDRYWEEPDGGWLAWSEFDDDPPELLTFISCRWCLGMWVAAGVVVASWAAPRAWRPLARTLAYSSAAVLLATLEDD